MEEEVVELAMDATSEDWWVELAVRMSSKSASASGKCLVGEPFYFSSSVLSLSSSPPSLSLVLIFLSPT